MILDLSKKQHVSLINMYKKCKGIALVDKYLPQLTPLNKMYVIDSLEDWEQVESEFPVTMMTVRCDCPKGVNGKLPSGQTFNRDRVKGYIQEVKSAVPNAVIILQDMKKGTNERIHTPELVCLVNLENLNSVYINEGISQSDRLVKLNSIAIHQMTLLTADNRIKKLEDITNDNRLYLES